MDSGEEYGADQELDDIITLHKETGAKVCIGTSSGGDLTTASLTEKNIEKRGNLQKPELF